MSFVDTRPHLLSLDTAVARNNSLRSSPRKVSLVAGLIRGMPVARALSQLKFCKKSVATEVLKVLNSAVANAENNKGLDIDRLYVSEVLVGKAITMKRFMARAKGRAARINKMFSNVAVFVSIRSDE